MRFTLDAVTESQNPWDRMNRWRRSEQRDFWYWLVKQRVGVKEREALKKQLHIVRVGEKLIDDGNVPSGCKYLIDALKEFGHIYQDSRKWLRVTFDQRKCKKDERPHMEVHLQLWNGD